MLININDDVNVNKTSQTKVVEKVSPVPAVKSIQGLPESGNNLHSHTAIADQNVGLQKTPSAEKLEEAVRDLNQHMQAVQRELHFSVDKDSGNTVIKVIDMATKEVIRQIPNEEALDVARMLGDGVDLKLFSEHT